MNNELEMIDKNANQIRNSSINVCRVKMMSGFCKNLLSSMSDGYKHRIICLTNGGSSYTSFFVVFSFCCRMLKMSWSSLLKVSCRHFRSRGKSSGFEFIASVNDDKDKLSGFTLVVSVNDENDLVMVFASLETEKNIYW